MAATSCSAVVIEGVAGVGVGAGRGAQAVVTRATNMKVRINVSLVKENKDVRCQNTDFRIQNARPLNSEICILASDVFAVQRNNLNRHPGARTGISSTESVGARSAPCPRGNTRRSAAPRG